eukprot:2442494-Amphidinium_carterae.1
MSPVSGARITEPCVSPCPLDLRWCATPLSKREPLKEQDATFEWMDEADSLLWQHSLAGGDVNSLWSLWNHAAEQYLGAQ